MAGEPAQLRKLIHQHPDRPLVLLLGSSRTAMGVKPDVWEAARPGLPGDPLLFNMAIVGSGPITELLTLRRVYADGFRPAVVLLEFWPPFLRQDGRFAEAARVDPRRLRWDDQSVVRDFFPAPEKTNRRMWLSRLNALSANNDRLAVQVDPELFRKSGRIDKEWAELDGWGWLPGMDPALDDAATRRRLREHQRRAYRDCFSGYAIHPDSDRALRAAVALRTNATRGSVSCIYRNPPSSSPGIRRKLNAPPAPFWPRFNASLRCRSSTRETGWPKRFLADGFHLSRIGAGAFTAQLGVAIAATFRETNPGGKR